MKIAATAVLFGLLLCTTGAGTLLHTVEASGLSYPAGAIDSPAEGSSVSGGITVSGWAIDVASASDTGVDRVDVYVDGVSRGQALYGRSRPDIGAGYGVRFTASGFMFLLDTAIVGGGSHTIEARAHSSAAGTVASYSRRISVSGSAAPTPGAATAPTPAPTPAPPPAPIPPQNFAKRFGVNAHIMWNTADQSALNAERARAAGLQSMRFDVDWDKLEPAKAVYDSAYLAQLDSAIDAVTSRGLQPLLVVITTPAWARGNSGTSASPPTDIEDYADTLGFLAKRYAARPGLAFEVWNEPNQIAFWNAPGGPDALTYARMLKAAYTSIKSAAPQATVVGGSIAFNDQAYLQGLYAFGGISGFYDALSLHPYSGNLPPDVAGDGYHSFILAVQQTLQTMADYGESSKPVWITEMGWSLDDVGEGDRAAHFRRAVELTRTWPQLAMFMAYLEDQLDSEPAVGLITAAGNPTPSWLAYSLSASTPAASASLAAGVLETPTEWTTTSSGDVVVSGWALDAAAASGPGVNKVQVYVDRVYRGDATYGLRRADLAAQYGQNFAGAGYSYSLSLSGLAPGSHIVEVRAQSAVSGTTASYLRGLRVTAVPTYPAGTIDWPQENMSVSATVSVSGWALDMGAASTAGADRVQVWVDNTYAGDAVYGLQRPDIGAAYGARFTGSGYLYQLNLADLAPGSHAIEVRARSIVTGADAIYRRTISVSR